LNIIFAGTPAFAGMALLSLLDSEHKVLAVLTQPDRPSGRGMKLEHSFVKQIAINSGLPMLQPATLKDNEIQKTLSTLNADAMIVAAYGLILPLKVLQTPRLGCLNIHASLLPRWRGAAPIQRAILAGDKETGVTVMQMNEGLDTGDILLMEKCPISANDTSATLHDKLASLGSKLIIKALNGLECGSLKAIPQDESLSTYADKLRKEEAKIDWTQSAALLERIVRGYQPFPVAYSNLNNTQLKIWQVRAINYAHGMPGEVIAIQNKEIIVACGEGGIALERLQRPGGKAMPCAQFLQGFTINVGDHFN
jgi:methionyl-tRNA formyltransferase